MFFTDDDKDRATTDRTLVLHVSRIPVLQLSQLIALLLIPWQINDSHPNDMSFVYLSRMPLLVLFHRRDFQNTTDMVIYIISSRQAISSVRSRR